MPRSESSPSRRCSRLVSAVGLGLGLTLVAHGVAAQDGPAEEPADGQAPAAVAPPEKPPEPVDPLAYVRALPSPEGPVSPAATPAAPATPPAVPAEPLPGAPDGDSETSTPAATPSKRAKAAVRATPARYQVSGALSGSVYSLWYDNQPESSALKGNRVTAEITPRYFFTPVRDDDAPRSLQPFLQRTSAAWLGVGAGTFETRQPGAPLDRTSSFYQAGPGFDLYVNPTLALTFGGAYSYSSLRDIETSEESHTVDGYGGFGIHLEDTRLNLSYSFSATATDGDWKEPRWGRAHASWFVVLNRKSSVRPWLTVLERGALVGAEAAFYTTKNTAPFLGVFGGSGALYQNEVLVTR